MKKVYLTLVVCIMLSTLGCEEISSLKQLTHTIKETHSYVTIENKELKLDYYEPKHVPSNGYTIIYVHGGGFSNGQRDSDKVIKLAEDLGKNGYSTVSLSYRLTRKGLGFGCDVPVSDKLKAFNDASEDISLALSYMLKNKADFNFNSDKVVLFGVSAGAEAILNLLFTTDKYNSEDQVNIKAVICKSGALSSLEGLKDKNILIQLFHGNNDKLVPFHSGSHRNCKKGDQGYLNLFGSRAIANKLKDLNKPYYMVTLNNGNHAMNGLSYSDSLKEVLTFLDAIRSNRFIKSVEKVYETN